MARKGMRKKLPKFPKQKLLKDGKTFKITSGRRTSRGFLVTQSPRKKRK